MSLHGLNMEDLYEADSSNHRTLISSRVASENCGETSTGGRTMSQPKSSSATAAVTRREYLSSSCPSLDRGPAASAMAALNHFTPHAGRDTAFAGLSHSLPDVLCTKNLFKTLEERRPCTGRRARRSGTQPAQTAQTSARRYPQTPPPSPTPSIGTEPVDVSATAPEATLVKIHVLTRYARAAGSADGDTRQINVDINSLLVCINVRPWVMILDLLSRPAYGPGRVRMRVDEGPPAGDLHTTLEMSVQNLAVQLNANSYEICEAQVRQLWLRQQMDSQGTSMQGRLGKVLIFDLTPFGGKVRSQRFSPCHSTSHTVHFHCNRHLKETLPGCMGSST